MSLAERLAAHFRAHPGVWLDGAHEIASIAGSYAWRTRISDLRREPFNMAIQNRVRRVTRTDGSTYQVSEYRYIPGRAQRGAGASPRDRVSECDCDGSGWRSVVVNGVERMIRCSCRTSTAIEANS